MKFLSKNTPPHMDQSGRSMVEIIATLSIIGVLSIGGIAGYSYGMNRHYANQTITDVTLRAIDILSQLSQNKIPSLAIWENEDSIYEISLNTEEAPTQYYITVKNVPYNVCNIIAETMNEEVEILVDNDTQECKEGYNTLDFAYNGFTSSTDIPPENEETNNCGTANCTECQTCDISTQTCINKPSNESKCTISTGTSGWCVDGVCQPDTCNCDTGQYCKDAIESCKYPSPSTTCMTPSYTSHTITFTDEDGITRTETWRALSNVNYWEAQDACAAMGGEMPSDPSVFALNWNGGTGAYSKNKRKEALVADGLTGSMWTRKTLDDSCSAYYVLGSSITTRYRNSRYSAVCKMPTTEP